MKMWLTLAITLVGGFLFIMAYLYLNQKNMVFFPTARLDITPDEIGLAYDDVRINVSDRESIHAWHFPPSDNPDGAARTVIFCHGNGGNISHRLETVQFLLSLGAGVLLFDYRGYGQSDGSPTESNCYADARACYDWLLEVHRLSPDQIIVFGRSLGGAVAVDLASNVPCAGLIVESSFTSAADMGRKMFPFLPIKLILRYRFDSADKLDRVGCPILVTHSADDEIIPFDLGRALYERSPQPKRFLDIYGGHNERGYLNDSTYREAIREMLETSGADASPENRGD